MLMTWFSRFSRSSLKKVAIFLLTISLLYGGIRLYYKVTDGFTIGNITSQYTYDPRWEIRSLSDDDKKLVDTVLNQKFTYLGKGCQSYVFLSEDGNYVLKFFKYQRFRPQTWLEYIDFIPFVKEYRLGKIEKKKRKLENVFRSWKIAFENLKDETGLIFVHLNKTETNHKTMLIYDKMGFEHQIPLDEMEFLVQRKAQMLCATIKELMESGKSGEAKQLLRRIIDTLLSEYSRGLADNDHALMQNTGVYEGRPVHIDVGQFVFNEEVKKPEVYKKELFNKTYKFRIWLEERYPELAIFLETELRRIIGDHFSTMVPYFKQHE